MLWGNIDRRARAVGYLLALTETKVSNSVKSSYYRSAILLISSIVEGLVFELVRQSTRDNGHVLWQTKDHQKRHEIPASVFGTARSLMICEPTPKDVKITDNGVDFGKLNLYAKNKGLVSEKEYKMLNKVRLERNRVHLQLMTTPDTGYTRNKVEMVSKPLPFLVKKLRAAQRV